MAIKDLLGKKEEKDPKKDEEVQKLREKFNDIAKTDTPETQKEQPKPVETPKPAQQPTDSEYKYVDPERAEDNERVTNLIMQQIKELIEIDNNLNKKLKS